MSIMTSCAYVFVDVVTSSQCTESEFACNNGNCIALALFNNTVNDCEDNSDEGQTLLNEVKRSNCNFSVCFLSRCGCYMSPLGGF